MRQPTSTKPYRLSQPKTNLKSLQSAAVEGVVRGEEEATIEASEAKAAAEVAEEVGEVSSKDSRTPAEVLVTTRTPQIVVVTATTATVTKVTSV